MNFLKSRATEPKRKTWVTLAERWRKSAPHVDQTIWLDSCLKKAGYDADAWKKTGEMPSELFCRYAKDAGKDIDTFLLSLTR